jgi:hypothetical protein
MHILIAHPNKACLSRLSTELLVESRRTVKTVSTLNEACSELLAAAEPGGRAFNAVLINADWPEDSYYDVLPSIGRKTATMLEDLLSKNDRLGELLREIKQGQNNLPAGLLFAIAAASANRHCPIHFGVLSDNNGVKAIGAMTSLWNEMYFKLPLYGVMNSQAAFGKYGDAG